MLLSLQKARAVLEDLILLPRRITVCTARITDRTFSYFVRRGKGSRFVGGTRLVVFPCPNRPQFEKTTSRDPLSSRDPLFSFFLLVHPTPPQAIFFPQHTLFLILCSVEETESTGAGFEEGSGRRRIGNGPKFRFSESTVSNEGLSEFIGPHRVLGRELSEFLSAYYVCGQSELTEFFAELTEFAAELSQ